jgi:transposase
MCGKAGLVRDPGAAGPPNVNAERCKDRNQVERAFNRLKQFRAVATRYDKLKSRYGATVIVAAIVVWLRAKPDRKTP